MELTSKQGMSNVQFDQEFQIPSYTSNFYTERVKGFSARIIKWGLADDEKGANKFMIGILIFCIIVSIGTVWLGNRKPNEKTLTRRQALELMRPHF